MKSKFDVLIVLYVPNKNDKKLHLEKKKKETQIKLTLSYSFLLNHLTARRAGIRPTKPWLNASSMERPV